LPASHDFKNVPVVNASQLGGIETSTLDNGPGKGVRIAWVNTGGGLRYKVVIDRGLDIADAEFLGNSLTWHSYGGVTTPRPAYNAGLEWLRGFYGGMVVSCGPQNIGGPVEVDGENYGLHGTHSNTMAQVESILNPDLKAGRHEMSISAIIKSSRVFGPDIELRRTLKSKLGEPGIEIEDRFTNYGNQAVRFAWLLHINVGYPLLEPGASTYCFNGVPKALPGSEKWYREGSDYRSAPQPMEEHRGTGEFCAYLSPKSIAGRHPNDVMVGVVNRKRNIGLKIEYSKNDYPVTVNWQHWGPNGSYVGALEPSTGVLGGDALKEPKSCFNQIEAGEVKTLRCKITATNAQSDMDELLKLNG
jgi:hypothetical protein